MTAPTTFSGFEQRALLRRRWVLIGIVVLVGVLVVGLFVSRALKIHHLQQQLIYLEAEKAKIQREIERLSARLTEKDNLKLIEYLARKELGMVKPGEQIYILIEDGEEEP